MFVPTYRSAKFLNILFFIYGVGTLLSVLMINRLTYTHLNNKDYDEEKKALIISKVDKYTSIGSILGCIFWTISLISLIVKNRLANEMGRQGDVIITVEDIEGSISTGTGGSDSQSFVYTGGYNGKYDEVDDDSYYKFTCEQNE